MSGHRRDSRLAPPVVALAVGMLCLVLIVGILVWFAARKPDAREAGAASPAGTTSTTSGEAATTAQSPTASSPTSEAGSAGTSPVPTSQGPAGVGRAAPSQAQPQRPSLVVLKSQTTVPVRVAHTGGDGVLQLPVDVRRAGWWDGSARVGDPLGSVVIAAHVDSLDQGLGVFAELLGARPGDRLDVKTRSSSQAYRVQTARLTPKTSLSASSPLYSAPTQPRLVLITCGGPFDPARGGYQDNFVVVATPVGRLTGR